MQEIESGTIQVGGFEANYSIAEPTAESKLYMKDGSPINGYFVTVKEKPLLIDYGGSKNFTSMKEFKQILSTFKFLP